MKISLWLKDGSVYKNATLAGAQLKVDGQPLDINNLDKIDDAYLYTLGGAQIYRNQITGSIQVTLAGVAGNLTISIDQISDLDRVTD